MVRVVFTDVFVHLTEGVGAALPCLEGPVGLSLLDEHDQANHSRNIAGDEKAVMRKSEPGYVQLESSEARKVARDDGW